MLQKLDQFDFHHRLADITGTCVIVFSSPDCGACQQLKLVLSQLSQVQKNWHFFEVDAQCDTALAKEFELFHLPALFLYSDGEFHCELQAEAHSESILATVADALTKPAKEAP